MSALYGYVPNLVQQQTPAKPVAETQAPAQSAQITPETAPAQTTKVAPAFRPNETPKSHADAGPNSEKQANLSRLMSSAATAVDTPQPKLAAESKVKANRADELTPKDLATKRAEELEKARAHAELYRAYKDKLEAEVSQNQSITFGDKETTPRMDVRIPLPDEIPDRPIPRLGVPTV